MSNKVNHKPAAPVADQKPAETPAPAETTTAPVDTVPAAVPAADAIPAAPKAEAVEPLKAIDQIVYGKGQVAPSQSIFTPVSQAERTELLDRGAAEELDEVERAAFKPAVEPDEDPLG